MTSIEARSAGCVLLVDDDPEILATFSAILVAHRFEVRTAVDLGAALQSLDCERSMRPDVVVTDLFMPDGTGLDLLANLRIRSIAVPIVMMSATLTPEATTTAERFGALRCLQKPISATRLVGVLQEVIAETTQAPAV